MSYSKFERATWNDEKVRTWRRDTRDVWIYLMTSPHMEGPGGRIGAYVLDPMYAAADLSCPDDRWVPDRVTAELATLQATGRIVWDPEVRVVLLVNFFRHNTPANPNTVEAAAAAVAEIPASVTVLERLQQSLEELLPERFRSDKPLRGPIVAAVEARLANVHRGSEINGSGTVPLTVGGTVRGTVAQPEQEQEQEQEQEHEHPSRGGALVERVAPLVERHLWLGDTPPAPVLERYPSWGVASEADIVQQWVRGRDVTDLDEGLDVIRLARHALDMGDRPFSLLLLHDRNHRGRLAETLAYVRRQAAGTPTARIDGPRPVFDDDGGDG